MVAAVLPRPRTALPILLAAHQPSECGASACLLA